MAQISKWTIICQTDGLVLTESETKPTECPNNSGHVIGDVMNVGPVPPCHVINLRVGDFIPNHDANPSPVEVIDGANISRLCHSFDYNVQEFLRHVFTIPSDIDPDGNVKFTFKWRPRVHPNPAQDVVFKIESIAVADGENWDQALASKGTLTSTSKVTTGQETTDSKIIPVADLEWEGDDDVVTRYSRDASNDDDTLDDTTSDDDDVLLLGVKIEIDRV